MSTPLQRRGVNRLIDLQEIGGSFSFAAGSLLVGDGSDSFDEQPVSGDATLAADGTLRVTQITDSGENVVADASGGELNLTNALIKAGGSTILEVEGGDLESVFLGFGAGGTTRTVIAENNFGIGANALASLTDGTGNIGIGAQAGEVLTDGLSNMFLGNVSGRKMTTGDRNCLVGPSTGRSLTTEDNNTYVGARAGEFASGHTNTGIGQDAGRNISGNFNTLIGDDAGDDLTSSNRSIVIGADLDAPSNTDDGQIVIGNLFFGTGADSTGTTIDSASKAGIGVNNPTSRLQVDGAVRPATYTVATVPSASTEGAGAEIHVSNGAAGSPVQAFSDGTDWLRCDTLAAISSS